MDYKQQVVNQIIAGSIGFLNNDQQTRMIDVMNIALWGMSLQDAQEVMGHSTPETTLIYYNNNNTNIHNKFNNLI